jgi:1-acyl-sn-glycerol-3-phosphate acyltransferase
MQRSLLWKFLQLITRIWTSFMFDLKTYGTRNVPRTGGVLLVSNHQSYLDPPLIAVHLLRPVSFMARSTLFENPLFSRLITELQAYPVRRGEADIGAIKETIRRLNAGNAVNVYPEGSRTETGEIGPIEKGIALIVRKANVPVVPVAIDGSFQAWPKGDKLFHSHPIRIIYGKPMHLHDLKADEIVAQIDAALRDLLNRLRAGNV